MAIKHMYEIVNQQSGQSLGAYEADSEQQALDAMAQEAGYENDAHMCREVPRSTNELRVALASVVVPD
jgi:hypothetical protein